MRLVERDENQLTFEVTDHQKQLLERILKDEEAHTDWLESQLSIIEEIGFPALRVRTLRIETLRDHVETNHGTRAAIFRARPSPFCILDEVDAPLDEANVRRFVVLVQAFLSQSQFIVITHNKITMAVADRLYGVTMQEKGVSKRVSVAFEQYDPDNPHAAMSTADVDEAPYEEAAPLAEDSTS